MYLILFLEVGYHDDGGAVKLPYHSPEVREGGRLGALSRDVRIGTIESLWPRERDRERERSEIGTCIYVFACVCVCVCVTDA